VANLTRDGKFPGGQVYNFSLKNHGVGLPASNPNLPANIAKVVAEYQSKIASGQIKVSEIPTK
jgi:basic membrane protein A